MGKTVYFNGKINSVRCDAVEKNLIGTFFRDKEGSISEMGEFVREGRKYDNPLDRILQSSRRRRISNHG